MSFVLDRIGRRIARYLDRPIEGFHPYTPTDPEALRATLQPADVLLVEGTNHISGVIKYLTQSTWSHAALYVGPIGERTTVDGEPLVLVEANIGEGVVGVPLSKYYRHHTRICRPVGLTDEDRERVIRFAIERIGHRYDLRNVIDLARYLLRTPPVPAQYRRRLLALGSGDPTRAICSTLIAQAFQSVRYPILPEVTREKLADPNCSQCYREYLHIRHHSLYAPRDFDISPYFRIVKPTLERGFDYRRLQWADRIEDAEPALITARDATREPARPTTH